MSPAENKAVFLSYASQDAEAVARIAEALRASGVEVWFDKDELVGGDAWDQKIRRQIKECALFVPVISANTNARAEGYFRLEWKLAVDRSHLMADDAPFLFPVVIDETTDAAARVPDRFREVQWTRLRPVGFGGQAPDDASLAAFCGRVGKLLRGENVARAFQAVDAAGDTGGKARATGKRGSGWMRNIGLIGGLVLGLIYAVRPMFFPAAVREKKTAAVAPAVASPTSSTAPVSEARQLAARARAMSFDKYNSTADDYAAAEGLIKRALELDANDGEIWAVSSLLNSQYRTRGFDYTPARREAARSQAERALTLAPDSIEGRYALARWQRDNDPDPAAAEKTFKDVLARAPEHTGATLALATQYSRTGRFEEAMAMSERAARHPEARPLARFQQFLALFGRRYFDDAERAVRESVAAEPSANSIAGLAMVLLTARGDAPAAVQAAGAAAVNRTDPRLVWVTTFAQLAARNPDGALATLQRMSADYISDNWFNGPKAYWEGRAHAQAGRTVAARIAFESGLAIAEAKLKTNPRESTLRLTYGEMLAALGRTDDALIEIQTMKELTRARFGIWTLSFARIYALLGRADDAIPLLDALVHTPVGEDRGWPLTPALLRIDPLWDKIRDDPRFQALCAEQEEKK